MDLCIHLVCQADKVQIRRRARGADAKVNMLILMSDTGGGHRASAQALEAALEDLFPGRISVTMVDIFTEHSRWPYSASVPAYQVSEPVKMYSRVDFGVCLEADAVGLGSGAEMLRSGPGFGSANLHDAV